MSVHEKLEAIRHELGLTSEAFWEMSISQLAMLRQGAVVGAKWTRGEIAQIVADKNGDAALEVLQYLDERGPRVVDWTDERAPCEYCHRLDGHSDRCLERQEEEARGEDYANRAEARESAGT